MSTDIDVFFKRLHLANARRIWQELVQRAEKEQWSYRQFLHTLLGAMGQRTSVSWNQTNAGPS